MVKAAAKGPTEFVLSAGLADGSVSGYGVVVMTPLLWMLSLLPQVMSAVRDLPQPVNISLTSNNFIHLLRWEPGPGSPRGVYYHVSVHSEKGISWEPVVGCELVQHPLLCNLTEALSDPRQLYFSRVRALLGDRTSEPAIGKDFLPIKETQLDLPLLTVTPCGRDLCVQLQPPMEHLREIYDSLSYKLSIRRGDADRAEFFRNTMSMKREVFKDLAPSRAYCVSVSISDSLVPRKSNYSQPECAVTTGVFTAGDVLISAVLCLLLVSCVVFAALLVWAGVFCLRVKTLPHVLTSIRHMEGPLVVVPCSEPLSPLSDMKKAPPSTCGKRNSRASDDSEGESEADTSAGSTGNEYKLRVSTNLPSAFVSSSSSSPLSRLPAALPNCSSNPNPVFLTSHSFSSGYEDSRSQLSPPPTLYPQPDALILADHHLTPQIKRALTSDPTSPSDSVPKTDQGAVGPHHHHMGSFNTVEGIELKEEEEEEAAMGEGSGQDVNLLTLTLGEREEEEEEEEQPHLNRPKVEPSPVESSYDVDPLLPPRAGDASLVDEEEDDDDDEEEEECGGYLTRPRAVHR